MTSRLRLALAASTALAAVALVGAAEAQQSPPPSPPASAPPSPQAAAPRPPNGGPAPAAAAQSDQDTANAPQGDLNQARAPENRAALLAGLAAMQPADRTALIDARLGAIKAGLELTPDQEKLWPPVEGAVRDGLSKALDLRRRYAGQTPSDPMQRLNRAAQIASERADALKALAAATQPLYASLQPDQKRRLPMLMGVANSIGGASFGESGRELGAQQFEGRREGLRRQGRDVEQGERMQGGSDEGQAESGPDAGRTWRQRMRQRMDRFGGRPDWRQGGDDDRRGDYGDNGGWRDGGENMESGD